MSDIPASSSAALARTYRGSLMLAISGVAWGGLFPIMKHALTDIDPVTFTLLRYGSAAVIFVTLLLIVEGRRSFALGGLWPRVAILGTLGFAGNGLFQSFGVLNTRPEHAAVITATMPLITVVINWAVSGVRPSRVSGLCIALGIIGVVLVVTDGDLRRFLGGGSALADLMVLSAATCWVIYTLGRASFSEWSTLRYTALTCAFASIVLGLTTGFAWWQGEGWFLPGSDGLQFSAAIGYAGLFASGAAVLTWNVGIALIGPTRGVLFVNLVPVTAFTIAVTQGRTPHPVEIAGVALVITALAVNSLYRPRPQPAT